MGGGAGGSRPRWAVGVIALMLASRPAAAATIVDGRFGRWSASGYAEGYGVWAVDHDSQRQRPEGILDAQLTGEVTRTARFFLDLRSLIGGPPEHASGLGFVNISDTFQNVSPEVEIPEGYLDLFLPSLDVRIGKQKFAWGKLDTFQPTDVLDPRRYTDPFVTEEQDAKLGIPALRASYFPPALGPTWPSDTSLTLVWVPVPVPVRFPLPGERWFPTALLLPPNFPIYKGVIASGVPRINVQSRLTASNVRPPHQLDEGAVGLRLAGLLAGADWALYYYDGPETAPAFDQTTLVHARDPAVSPRGAARVQADTDLHPRFGRIRLAGADVAMPFGGFTARVEAAYGADRLLPRSAQSLVSPENLRRLGPQATDLLTALQMGKTVPVDLGSLSLARNTVDWGAGVDYRYRGWMPVLQLNQTFVLNNSAELLVNNIETRLFLVVRRNFLDDRLGSEVGIVQEFERGYTTGLARATYALSDNWRVRLGYLLIAGTRNSRIGQYHDNDEAFLQIRYTY
jgi:hypothetical protein